MSPLFLRLFSGASLKARSLRGTALTGVSFLGQNVIRLGGNLILTRILFPEAFGIMALVQIAMTGLNMFSDLGFRAAIIKDKRWDDPVYLDTAWTLQILRGLLLWLAAWAVASPIAAFYEVPILADLLPVVGLTAVLQGFNSTKMATVNRELTLGRLTVITLGSQFVGLLVTLVLTLWLQSVWGLVLGGLVGPLILAVLSHLSLPGRSNRMRFELSAFHNLIGFGAFIFLASAANFLSSQGDRAILGKYVTLDVLALYGIAYFLATVPQKLLLQLIDKILFPLYASRPPLESPANARTVAKARAGIIAISLLGAALLALIGNWLVILLYDPRYEAAGPLLVLIAIAYMPTICFGNYSVAILAAGNSRGFSTYQILSALLRTALIFLGVTYFGLVGVALAPAVASLLFYPVSVLLIRRYGAWLPLHDAVFILLALGFAALAVYVNWESLSVLSLAPAS